MSTTHLHQTSPSDNPLDARAVRRRTHRLWAWPLEAFWRFYDDRLQHMGRRLGGTPTLSRVSLTAPDIDVRVVRDGKNLKGRLLGLKAFENSGKAIEARNSSARTAGASGS